MRVLARNCGRRVSLILTLVTLLTACQDTSSTDHILNWTFTPLWSVGGASDSAVALSLLMPWDIAVNDSGQIYLLGSTERRIYALNAAGRLINTLGHEGKGPGEFESPEWIQVTDAGGIVVGDMATRRMVRWSAQGESLEPVPIREFVFGAQVALDDGGMWYTTFVATEGGHSETRLVRSAAGETEVEARVQRQKRRVGDFPSCGAYQISVQPLFAPRLIWSMSGSHAAVNADPDYRIVRLERGVAVDTITRDITPAVATDALAEREAEDWLMNGCLVPPAEVIAVTGHMDRVPVIQELKMAPSGELWVRHRDAAGNSGGVDVFAPDGRFVGTLPGSTPFPAAFLSRDRILAIGKDSSDVPVVTMYRVGR
jgi:hypothetical protein